MHCLHFSDIYVCYMYVYAKTENVTTRPNKFVVLIKRYQSLRILQIRMLEQLVGVL